VGDRVLTKQFVTDEIGRLDLGDLLARVAMRITSEDIGKATRAVARWLVIQIPPRAIHDLLERLRQLLATRAWAPTLASVLDGARQRGWDEHLVEVAFRTLADGLERPAMSAAVADLIEDLLLRYRESLAGYPRFWLGVADFMGLIDRRRIVAALRSGAREIAEDPGHPARLTLLGALRELPPRLRSDPALAARVDAVAREMLEGERVRRLLQDVADLLERHVVADLDRPRSELIAWMAERLEGARRGVLADDELRRQVDGWVKRHLADLIERHHGRLAEFIEKGVLALGAGGAVGLIEDHAGDDLQYIRVNGTVVGGLAGGAIYGVHLLLRLV
jgi:uncharacterized membrane-anchored protein YjiN (DUF445 family)